MNEYLGNIRLTKCKEINCVKCNHVFFVVTSRRVGVHEFSYSYYGYFGGKTFQYLKNNVLQITEKDISEAVRKKLKKRISLIEAISPNHSTYQSYIRYDIGEYSQQDLIDFVNDH